MEKRIEKLKTKEKWYAHDEENDIDVLCREYFPTTKREILYPFTKDGKQRHKTIQKIVFEKVERESLTGFRTFRSGFGFTRYLIPLITYLEINFPVIHTVMIVPDSKTTSLQKTKGIFQITKSETQDLYRRIKPTRDKHSKELSSLIQNFLSTRITVIKKSKPEYVPDSFAKLVNEYFDYKGELSKSDIERLTELSLKKLDELKKVGKEFVLQTKKEIESVYIEDVIEEFEKIYKQTTDGNQLEKTWQKFFKKHPWVFTLLSPQALTLFGKEAYLGGQDIKGKGSTVTDFIYKNDLTKNLCIIEIKTHLTDCVSKYAYRKGAGVHSVTSKLTGAINQGLDQKDTITKEFYMKYYSSRTKKGEVFEVFNPRVLVIAGNVKKLKKNKKKSFELFRNSSKEVEVIGYDEVYERLKMVKKLIEK